MYALIPRALFSPYPNSNETEIQGSGREALINFPGGGSPFGIGAMLILHESDI